MQRGDESYRRAQSCHKGHHNVGSYSLRCRGGSRYFWKGGALYRPPWLAEEENLGFRWFKKARIKLETISFWQNISISIFKFSPFLCTMKAYGCNICCFSKFTNALIRKEKKTLIKQSMRKEKLRNLYFVL